MCACAFDVLLSLTSTKTTQSFSRPTTIEEDIRVPHIGIEPEILQIGNKHFNHTALHAPVPSTSPLLYIYWS